MSDTIKHENNYSKTNVILNSLLIIANLIILAGAAYITFSEPGKVFMNLPTTINNLQKTIENTNQKIDKTYGKISKIDNAYNLNGFKKTNILLSKDDSLSDFSVYYDRGSNLIKDLDDIGKKRVIFSNDFDDIGNPTITVSIRSAIKNKNKTIYGFSVSKRLLNILSNNKKKVSLKNIKFKIIK